MKNAILASAAALALAFPALARAQAVAEYAPKSVSYVYNNVPVSIDLFTLKGTDRAEYCFITAYKNTAPNSTQCTAAEFTDVLGVNPILGSTSDDNYAEFDLTVQFGPAILTDFTYVFLEIQFLDSNYNFIYTYYSPVFNVRAR